MSEGADSVTRTCGNSLATSSTGESDATSGTATPPPSPLSPPPPPSPSTTTRYTTGRRPRFGTGGPPPSPYVWVDGRQLRSALAWTNKWPTRPPGALPLRVNFPANDNHLVTGYLEPANPWRHAENVNREDLIFAYKESCTRHNTEPLLNVLVQLENLDISQDRCEQLNLKGEILDQDHSEPLEEILKRVQFNKIDLEGTSLSDESAVILFDMLEYYESAKHLNISLNPDIGARGWQACSHMIKKTQCLEQLEARDIMFNEQNMNILSRALRLACHLHVLKLENCGLSGRATVILVTALKMNTGIRELYLADNRLDLYDAIQLGSLLRINNHLQLLDISNNNVQDDGVRDILEGLINQVNEDKTGKGLSILILWNNRLTKNSSPYISRIIALSKTLETLNIGQNMLTDETLRVINESLKQNRVLLQLGMQSTELTCEGIITLAEIMETNQVLQRIDLRDNSIQMRGMRALANVMKMNKTITQIDLDDKPRIRIDGLLHEYKELVAEIRGRCNQNEEERRLLEETTEDAESPQHPSRLLNASSRKISLTCQTLPNPSSGRSATSLTADEPATRATLEPAKRTSGGRLRSPAPSPIPSPVASPVPSPSRNRFVVCRVPEASLRSTDSSASTSPVTPPSLGSSPNFFSGASSGGSSRFRVSVVESASAGRSSPKSVVSSTSGSSITIGFNVRIDAADSDDSDSVINKTDANDTAASASDMFHVVPLTKEASSSSEDVAKNEDHCDGEMKISSSEQQVKTDEIVIVTSKDECEKMTEIKEEIKEEELDQNYVTGTWQSEKNEMDCDENGSNPSNVTTMNFEIVATDDRNTETIADRRIVYKSTKELQVPAYPNENTISISVVEDETSNAIKLSSDNTSESSRATSEELSTCLSKSSASTTCRGMFSTRTTESHSQEQPSTSVQKHKSSLEKLLSLFQHPGQFFSDSSSVAMDTKSSLQENVSGVMALGDKLQQYLKESRTKVDSSCSSEHGSPLKNKSMGMNISQLQNLTGIFASSFKLEPQTCLVEHGTKIFGQVKTQDTDIRKRDLEESTEIEVAKIDNKRNLLDRENNQLTRDDGNNLMKQNQMIKSGEKNLFDQKQNQSMKDDEKDLIGEEKNQIIGRDENLFDQEKSQVSKNNEQKLFDQISRDNKKDFINQEESQVSNNDENELFDWMKNRTIGIDERNLEDQKKKQYMVRNADEKFEESEDIQERGEVVDDDSEDQRLRDNIARNDGKNSASVRDGARDVNEEENACNTDDLRWTESDRISNRLLPESVQSKDDFANNLVLGDCHVATNAAAVLPSSPASESTACINIRLTDIAGYSALGLGKIADVCIECNDAKRFEDFIGEEERDDMPQDSKRTERNDDAECLRRDDSKILGSNDAKCLQHDAIEETNAAMIRTCDITDSINQTSDSRFFSISNIAYCSKKAVDSISIASITTDDDVDMIRSVSENSGLSSTSSMSSKDASVYLNEEVTSNMHRDHRCDFMRREEEGEDLHDDNAYRDSVDRATSTSINIKIDSQGELETTSPNDSHETPERQLFILNNTDKHRIILQDAAESANHSENEESKRTVDPTILITPSPHEMSVTNLDKSDAEQFIFCTTDVSTDGTSIEDELSPQGVTSRNSPNKPAESYFELPASNTIVATSSTLLIENPGSVHRNSQDSGIEETALAIDDTVVEMTEVPLILPPTPPPPPPPPLPPPSRSSLQESVDSGIESECSSICIRMESATTGISTLEMVTTSKTPTRDDNDDEEEFGEFASDFLARETRLVDSDSTSGDGDGVSYLSGIKCTVVNSVQPVADEGVTRPAASMIAHSPAAVHGTSPK